MMKACQITREEHGDLDVLHLDGALDAGSFNRLESALQMLHAKKRHHVVLDCENLVYISSVNLGALINFARNARSESGRLVLAALSPQIQKIINLLGFDSMLDVYPDLDRAISACSLD